MRKPIDSGGSPSSKTDIGKTTNTEGARRWSKHQRSGKKIVKSHCHTMESVSLLVTADVLFMPEVELMAKLLTVPANQILFRHLL